MFEKFVEDISKMPQPVSLVTEVDLTNAPGVNPELLKQKILNNEQMSDEELFNLLKESHETIMRCIFDMEDPTYLRYCTTKRFISILCQVMTTVPVINTMERMYCNKLAYDYMTYDKHHDDAAYIAELMMGLSRTVNRDVISVLKSIELPEDISTYIALSRHSSTIETTNIMRVNFLICNNVSRLFDLNSDAGRVSAEQMIINIYQKLFPQLTLLFEAIMFDVYNLEDEWVDNSISEMYSIISLAILDILNAMPSGDIRKVLMGYAMDYTALKMKKYRFSLNSLSADYDRIRYVVDVLRGENIFIP